MSSRAIHVQTLLSLENGASKMTYERAIDRQTTSRIGSDGHQWDRRRESGDGDGDGDGDDDGDDDDDGDGGVMVIPLLHSSTAMLASLTDRTMWW